MLTKTVVTCADPECQHPAVDHPTMRGIIGGGITYAIVPYCDVCERNCSGVFNE